MSPGATCRAGAWACPHYRDHATGTGATPGVLTSRPDQGQGDERAVESGMASAIAVRVVGLVVQVRVWHCVMRPVWRGGWRRARRQVRRKWRERRGERRERREQWAAVDVAGAASAAGGGGAGIEGVPEVGCCTAVSADVCSCLRPWRSGEGVCDGSSVSGGGGSGDGAGGSEGGGG
jgi:hypothetical protein